eukprot:807170-Rhodomonas_salina.1
MRTPGVPSHDAAIQVVQGDLQASGAPLCLTQCGTDCSWLPTSGTDVVYGHGASSLRARYAMAGTEVAYVGQVHPDSEEAAEGGQQAHLNVSYPPPSSLGPVRDCQWCG